MACHWTSGENLVPMSVVMNSVLLTPREAWAGRWGPKTSKPSLCEAPGSVRIAERQARLGEGHQATTCPCLGANNQHVVPNSPQPWAEHSNSGHALGGICRGACGVRLTRRSTPARATPAISTASPTEPTASPIFLGDAGLEIHGQRQRLYGLPDPLPHHAQSSRRSPQNMASRRSGRTPAAGCNFGREFFKSFPDGQPRADRDRSRHGGHAPGRRPGHLEQLPAAAARLPEVLLRGHSQGQNGPSRNTRATPGIDTKKATRPSCFSCCRASPTRKASSRRRSGWGPATPWSAGAFPKTSGRKISSFRTGRWGTPSTTPTKTRASAGSSSTRNTIAMPSAIRTPISPATVCRSRCRNGLAVELWGSAEAVDPAMAVHAHEPSTRRGWPSGRCLRKELHDSLALCNWMGPWVASPLRGARLPRGQLDRVAALQPGDRGQEIPGGARPDGRADSSCSIARSPSGKWGPTDMRAQHDTIPDWVFDVRHVQGAIQPPEPSAWTGTTSVWPWTCSTARWAGTRKPAHRLRHIP